MSKLVLIDGNSIAYRAFFALPLLNNQKGVYTNAVYGFTTMLLKVLEEEDPSHILVAFDAGKTTFRHETFDEYKSGRQKTPSELSEQLPLIRETLDAFQISHTELANYEADDIIGTLSKQAEAEGWDVRVYTGDKDLLQLVSDKTTVALTKKGVTNIESYDVAAIDEKYGIKPAQIVDMKGLMGDSSDNIPGVPGIGEKTALKLLKEYDSVENVLDSIEHISGKKMKERLTEHKKQALMSKELAVIYRDVPLQVAIEEIKRRSYDTKQLSELFKELEFQSLLGSIDGAENEKESLEDISFEAVDTLSEDMLKSPSALMVEVPHENYHHADIWGISVVHEDGRYYFPLEAAVKSDAFRKWAQDASKEKYTFDTKRAMVALGWHGITLKGVTHDALIASYLIDPSVSSHSVTDIASRQQKNIVHSDEAVYGKGAKQKKPEDPDLAEHLVRKGEAVFTLKPRLEEELKNNEQFQLFTELEMPLTLILGEMETTGVKVDKQQLEKIGTELDEKLDQLQSDIYELAGTEFNINSPKQLGPILFEKLDLPVIKKTKTGYSTSADVLEKLEDKHDIIPKLLLYRQVSKLKSTYIEGLLKVIHPDTNKIHTMFNQAITQTGRLSSTEPNLQNIPIRLEEGRRIRKAFISAEPGWSILAADYSQIELRVLAHIAKDEGLMEAFQKNMDVHTKTAMDVFHVDEDDVTSNMRRTAKAVNFGIVYGISDYGLSQSLGITRKEAQEFIDRYLASYPNVKEYMDDIKEEAREKGYVTTLLNRRRYLPEITSKNFNRRSFAERTAMNTPIQGTAADIIKQAMVDVNEALNNQNLHSRLLLQVHDELIFEVPEEEIDTMKELVSSVMEKTMQLDVPLEVEVSYGPTWYDAK
ncbi:DNA polymerase I [Alteribacillus persepolensis]|uniref:DNA polymerase I n=1 Tax=Alteribacillus persepolensis TaxID=568899 RepID=A0A1G8BJH8_9BACI|nr:DNA polymerase I [Alteribacillus persepolensis]SDH33382.1 DNA polymerase I [Alteribacillus persepolensis]